MLVSFDLDGVLMRNPFRDGVFPELARALAPGFGGDARAAIQAIVDEYYRRLHEARRAEGNTAATGAGGVPAAVAPYHWDGIVAAVAGRCGLQGIPPEPVAAMVARYASQGGYVSLQHPTVPGALAALRRGGHRLLAVTNGLWAYQEPVLQALGLAGAFERVAAPDLTGRAKPDEAAFYAAVGEARAPEAVHVGDDLLYDVAAARRAGLRAVWVIPPRLARLSELRRLAPWERPAYLQDIAAWHDELRRTLERRPPADGQLVDRALPDAAVLHVGELPAVVEHWTRHGAMAVSPGRAGAPGPGRPSRRRWEVPVVPLPAVGEALVAWYGRARRELPWRRSRDPYAVLVSEFMLQRTQVATVVPYFERFMARFPTLEALARASLDDVLQVWQGLGYYRRARHLHEAARAVLERYGGRIPDAPQQLRRLPGVGPYMAGAISAIAFGRPEPAVDGNASRVLARLLSWWDPPGTAAARRLGEWARGMIPPGRAADFTQALMELGSRICRPARPLCGECPVQRFCSAWAYRLQEELPPRRAAPAAPVEEVAAAVVVDGSGRVLVVRRGDGGLLGSLWALPAAVRRDGEAWEQAALRAAEQAGADARLVRELGEITHAFSHRRWRVRAFLARPEEDPPVAGAPPAAAEPLEPYGTGPASASRARWVGPEEIPSIPMGRPFRRILELAGSAGVRGTAGQAGQ